MLIRKKGALVKSGIVFLLLAMAFTLVSCDNMGGRLPIFTTSFASTEEFLQYLSDGDTLYNEKQYTFFLFSDCESIDIDSYQYSVLTTVEHGVIYELLGIKPKYDYQIMDSNVRINMKVDGHNVYCDYAANATETIDVSLLNFDNIVFNEDNYMYSCKMSLIYGTHEIARFTIESTNKLSEKEVDEICKLLLENLYTIVV